jgi:hypothetical protein
MVSHVQIITHFYPPVIPALSPELKAAHSALRLVRRKRKTDYNTKPQQSLVETAAERNL